MSATELQAAFEAAQAEVHDLQAHKDAEVARLRGEVARAVDALAELHQRWRDALAREALEGREDAADVAARLGLTE